MENKIKCPVCEYDLNYEAYMNGIPSDEICPQCGIQFGLDDIEFDGELRLAFYEGWKKKWILDGRNFWSKSHKSN